MDSEKTFPQASIVEGLRFTAQIAVPNVIQGLFRRRRNAVAVAGRAGADKLAVAFMASLKRSYGEGPVWIRVAKDNALLVLGEAPIRRVLQNSPEPFASDPEPKRSGMAHFQPDALTISRNPRWQQRRAFAEAVLDTQEPVHRCADRFATVTVEEAGKLTGRVNWERFNETVRVVTRRIILGDAAGPDSELSKLLGELMDKSNPPGKGDDRLYQQFLGKLRRHVESAEEGSLASLIPQAPSVGNDPAGQVTHWLFALGDTLALNAIRCLAVLAGDPDTASRVREEIDGADLTSGAGIAGLELLGGCLEEAMRLWPSTPMLSRETVADFDWDGVPVPAGTQVLIVNTFHHRDRDAHAFADRFAPDEWVGGDAGSDWSFNHFSHGPQGCPGTGLAMLVGKAMLAKILRDNEIDPLGQRLDVSKPMPHSLDYFGLEFELTPRA